MRLLCSVFVVLVAGILQLVSAQGSNSITVPPNGFEVIAGELITIEWTNPSVRTVTIQLIPASGAGGIITLGSMLTNNGSATLLIPFDVPTTQQYQFKITDDSNSSNVYISPAFGISPAINSPSSTATVAASSSSATVASTSLGSASSSSSTSLSPGVIAGISIGGVLGLALIVGLAIFYLRRHRQHKDSMLRQQQQQQMQQQQLQHPGTPSQASGAPPYSAGYSYQGMDPAVLSHVVVPPKTMEHVPEPIEVPGSKSWPREVEGTPRYELPASPIEAEGHRRSEIG